MESNDQAGIAFAQPKSFADREKVASTCSTSLDLDMPVVVDGMENATSNAYSAFPDRLYIVDLEGKVAYKGGRGPFGYKAREMEQNLILLLLEQVLQNQAKNSP